MESGIIRRHWRKLGIFSVIGGVVFVAGLALQIALVRLAGLGPDVAYVAQAVFSIELSFLFNRYLTWRDRDVPLWRACWRWNTQKAAAAIINMIAYVGLVRLGMEYIAANVLLTALFTPVNYLGGHFWSFVSRPAPSLAARPPPSPVAPSAPFVAGPAPSPVAVPAPPPAAPSPPRPAAALRTRVWPVTIAQPEVSIVIPCRESEATVRGTVDSLVAQDYPALKEIILVGSPGDSTRRAIADVTDRRVLFVEAGTAPPGMRDANFKRDLGIRRSSGFLVALVDSDIVLPPDWLSGAVAELLGSGSACVTGGMRSIDDTFWGRYVDNNRLGAKTPRIDRPYLVTPRDFGTHGHKPPVTANVLFTRRMYQDCPIDPAWSHGSFEDYEWFWRIAERGHKVMVSDKIFGWHHHRAGMALCREHVRSGRGCAAFIQAHRRSPLARKRLRQAVLLPSAIVAADIGVYAAVATGHGREAGIAVASCGAAIGGVFCGREFARSRTLESLRYPWPALALGLSYIVGLAAGLVRVPRDPAAGEVATVPAAPGVPRLAGPRTRRLLPVLAMTAIIAVGTALRLVQLQGRPEWQVDEVTYTAIGRQLQEHGTLNLPMAYGQSWEPFLFHPPFYFLLLARWFAVFGAGVYSARVFGVLAAAVTFGLLARLLYKLYGPGAAAFALVLIVCDGWLLYIQRISYVENVQMILIVAVFLAYQWAIERPGIGRFVLTGVLAGAASIFKHTGVFVLLAIALAWAVSRRSHKEHAACMAAALAVIGAYVAVMVRLFDLGGDRNWYIQQTTDQVNRVIGYSRQSQGSLASPSQFLHLLTHQYALFIPSLLVVVAVLVLIAWCLRRRSLEPVRQDLVLMCWSLAGLISFGLIAIRYGQYFELTLIPVYAYLWVKVYAAIQQRRWPQPRKLAALAAVLAVVLGVNLGWTYRDRALASYPNAFEEAAQYARTSIPRDAVVVAAEPVNYEIPQPWCSDNHVPLSQPCERNASYAITWQTYLQPSNPLHDPSLTEILRNSVVLRRFPTFSGTATVWKVKR